MANRMTPFAIPASTPAPGASDNVSGRATGNVNPLELPCAKKAMERPSGDQNGYEAPSVPCSG